MKSFIRASLILMFFIAPLTSDAKAKLTPKQKEEKVVTENLKSAVDEILAVLNNDELNLIEKKHRVTEEAAPLFDIPLMAKLILGRKHWSKLNSKQQETFIELYIKLMQASYFDKVDLLSDEKVVYSKPIRNKNKLFLMTHVVTKDQRINIAYKYHKREDVKNPKKAWKVYDVEIAGISIIKSYGSQYKQYLSDEKNTFEGLLDQMRGKINKFEKKLKDKMAAKEKSTDKSSEKTAAKK